MSHDNLFALKNPAVANEVRDALTEVLPEGARSLLAQAIEAEMAEFLARHGDKRDAAGRARLVRNGCLPEHTIQTGPGEGAAGARSGRAAVLCLLDPAAVSAAYQDE